MDFLNDVPMSDPFLCLDTDLDDVSEVIRNNWTMSSYCVNGPSYSDPSGWSHVRESDPREGFNFLELHQQRSPSVYDQNTSREIGSIISHLQESEHIYDANNFQNFVERPLHIEATPMMLSPVPCASLANPPSPSLAASSNSEYYHGGGFLLDHQIAHESHDGLVAAVETQSIRGERSAVSEDFDVGCPEEPPRNTKEELLQLLASMTPAEVEQLRQMPTKRRWPVAIGVATKMTLAKNVKSPSLAGHELSAIPRRTPSVPFSSSQPSASSVDFAHDTNDSDIDSDMSLPTRRGAKVERRTAHNLIEKKYRCSINDRIQRLKVMLAGEEAKLSKSATLRKAIDSISSLRKRNEELEVEVETLRRTLKSHGIEIPPAHTASDSGADLMGPCSPNSASSASNPDSPLMSPTPRNKQPKAMVDKSRVALFAFMFMLLLWNPVEFFMAPSSVNKAADSQPVFTRIALPGRTLQQISNNVPFDSAESEKIWWQSSIVRPCFIWSVNVFIVVCFLTRLLVYGEPVVDAKSPSWAAFLNMKSAADDYIRRGNFIEATKQLQECLQVLERPLPSAGFDELVSVVWQVIRHLLNGLWVGRWFSRRRRSATKPVTVVCRSHAQTALIYHQLHQLHLIGVDEMGDGLSGLNLALSAVNLAESAGCSSDGLTHIHRADIYLNAAFRVKITLPRYIGTILYLYFLKRAKSHAGRAESDEIRGLLWVFHPLARTFLSDPAVLATHLRGKRCNHSPFVANCLSVKPVEHLTTAFKLELLTSLIAEVISPSGMKVSHFVEISHLLLSICTGVLCKNSSESRKLLKSTGFNTEGDELCSWWTHVFTCAFHWKYGDNSSAHKHYALVRKCPRHLLAEPISLAVGYAFCSRKLCVDDRNSRHFSEVVWAHTTNSFCVLQRVASPNSAIPLSHAAQNINEMARLLALEWLLMSILDMWYLKLNNVVPYWEQTPARSLKDLYDESFLQFRLIARANKSARCKTAIFELASRMLNGANPVNTWRSLNQISRREQQSTSNRLFCCLPRTERTRNYCFHLDILHKLQLDINMFCSIS